jgi:hypothetical protein
MMTDPMLPQPYSTRQVVKETADTLYPDSGTVERNGWEPVSAGTVQHHHCGILQLAIQY